MLPELIASTYFAYLAAVACVIRVPDATRRFVIASGVGLGAGIIALALVPQTRVIAVLRDWLPAAYVLVGYWLSGTLFTRPMPRWEEWLLRTDSVAFERLHIDERVERAPRAALELLEAAYLLVYLLVPGGIATLYVAGLVEHADSFWTVVLPAELICYGCLPWIQTRPPRALEPDTAMDRRDLAVRRLNLLVLCRGSIQVNTFPSGHAAGALAIALATWNVLPAAGITYLLVALAIALASIVGRYHYIADSVAGLLLAAAVWVLVGQ